MKIPEDDSVKREFCKFEVLTSIALNQKKWQLLVPVWGWKVTKGADKRIYLGLLTTRSQGLDALRSVQSVYRCTRNSKYAARRLKRYDDLFVLRIPDVMFWRKKSPVQICRKKSIGRRFDKGLDLQK